MSPATTCHVPESSKVVIAAPETGEQGRCAALESSTRELARRLEPTRVLYQLSYLAAQ